MIPPELNRQHVLAAINRCLSEGFPRKRRSTKHCLVYDGRHFAPKYIISEACRAFYPDGLDPDLFSGGPETNQVLEALGFHVELCQCGGLVDVASGAAAAAAVLNPVPEPAVRQGVVVTACLASPDVLMPNRQRMGLLKALLPTVTQRAQGAPFLLVLPAGFLDSGRRDPLLLCHQTAATISQSLQHAPVGSTVCYGVDGHDGKAQLGCAATREGLIALGRKFFAAPGEGIRAADSPFALEEGYPRTFAFSGRTYYLAVCYDAFGIRKQTVPNQGVDGIISLVHWFAPPGEAGSGAGYFARYGFAGASRVWSCPVYGAVVFHDRVQPGWPSGVLWDQIDLDPKRWTYADNPLAPSETWTVQHRTESATLAMF